MIKIPINTITGQIFEFFSDITSAVTYHYTDSQPVYNPATGVITRSDQQTFSNVPAIFVGFRQEEIDGERVRPEDKKCLIQYKDVPIRPKLDDYMTTINGDIEIIQVRREQSESVHVFHVRFP